jgi:hypothetical protein
MKIALFIFLFLIPLTSAIQFSPTSLEFNLEKNQVGCKNINFQIESQTTVHDTWAESQYSAWSITNFQTSSQEHGIDIDYASQINSDQEKIEVCLSGSTPGDYKGALIFREGEVGNSVVQFAVWLKVSISGETEEKSSGSSHHSSSSSNAVLVSGTNSPEPKPTTQQLSFNFPQEEIRLNSQAKQQNHSSANSILWIILPAIPIILLLFLILIRR